MPFMYIRDQDIRPTSGKFRCMVQSAVFLGTYNVGFLYAGSLNTSYAGRNVNEKQFQYEPFISFWIENL
jgi:hypothetical protein